MDRGPLPGLMLVTDRRRCRGRDLVEVVLAAVAGGVRFVQLREKDLDDAAFEALAARLAAALPGSVRLALNGRARVAASLGALLHLPAGAPLPPGAGPHGRSIHTVEEAAGARDEGAAWAVGGAVFPTAAKPGFAGCGTEGLARLCAAADPVPVLAVGGIVAARVAEVLAAGARGVAVCGAILEADDPTAAARSLAACLPPGLVSRLGSGVY